MIRRRSNRRPLLVLLAAGLGLIAVPAAADAAKVANPGNFNAPVSSGLLRVKEDVFSFDSSTPVNLSGTLNSAGQISNGNVSFPTLPVSAGGFDLQVKINPASSNAVSGTINPLTGEGNVRMRVWIKIDGVPFGGGCRIASASSPIDVNALVTGTTSPPGPNTPISGTPYNTSNGTMKIVNNSFSVPESSDCGIAAGTVNGELGLPSAAGNNEAQFSLKTNPTFTRGITAALNAGPATSGFAPLAVNFDASGSTHSAAVQNYQWDFDGNGTFDRTTTGATTSFTYNSGGTFNAKVRVTDVDGDFAEATRTITVTNRPDLTVESTHADPFRVGTQGIYELVAKNVGGGPTTDTVTVTDTLPAGLNYVSAAGTGWSCSAVSQVVTCTRPSIAANTTAPTINLTVAPTTAAMPQVTNSVAISTANELNLANNSDTDQTNVRAVDLTIDKSHDAEHFRLGADPANVYEIEVENEGTAPTFASTIVTDTLPAGLSYVNGTGTGWSCGAVGQQVTCTHAAPIAAGAAAAPIELEVSAALAAGETSAMVTNTATVATLDDIDGADNSASDETLILDAPDLRMTKSHSGNFVAGAQGEYTLAVRNIGPQPTDGPTTVTDTLPAGLTPTAASGAGWNCSIAGQDVSCEHADPIAADSDAAAISLTASVGEAAIPSVTNTATVDHPDDPNGANDSSSDETLVRAIDLTIDKSHDDAFRVDGNGVYRFKVTNVGDSGTVATTTITDTLPAGLTYVTESGAGWSCSASGQDVTCNHPGTIAAGDSAADLEVTVAVDASAAPGVTNTATVDTLDDFNPSNDTDSDTTAVVEQDAAISIKRTGSFVSGSNGTYLISVDNAGTRPTTGDITVTTSLPDGLDLVSVGGDGWNCSNIGDDITCTRPGPLSAETPLPDIALRVAVTPDAAPSVTTTVNVSTADDRNPDNDSASDTATVTGPDLAINSTHTGSFRAGGVGEYSIAVRNDGNGPSRNATTVTDTLPAGLTPLEAFGDGWDCAISGQDVTCERSAEIAAASAAPAITLRVSVAPSAAPSVTHQVAVSTPGDTDPSNDTDQDLTAVVVVDLAVDLDSDASFAVGSRGDYAIDVTNEGTAATQGTIRVTDTLPAGLTPVGTGGDGWDCSITGQDVSCARPGPLAPDASAPTLVLTVDVGAAVANPAVNTATVATVDDGNNANDSDDHETPVTRNPDLAFELEPRAAGGLRVGGEGAYELSVRNVGGSATTGATEISVTLGNGLAFLPSGGAGWTCSATGPEVTCTHAAALATGARTDLDLNFEVLPVAGDEVSTEGSVATTGDVNDTNDSASNTSSVTRIDAALTRSHSGDFASGQQGTYELVVENVGSHATVGPTVVTDTLPAGVTYNTASGAGWACEASADEVTCTHEAPIAAASAAGAISVIVDLGDAATPEATASAQVSTPDDANPANNAAEDTFIVSDRPLEAPRLGAAQIITKKTRPTTSGLVFVYVRCPDEVDARCQGDLKLKSAGKVQRSDGRRARVGFGSGNFDAAKGRVAPAVVRLSQRNRKLLDELGKLKLKATATTFGLPPVKRNIILRAR